MGVLLDEIHFSGGPAVLEVNALAILPAQPLETLTECGDARLTFGVAFHNGREDAHGGYAAGLLRPRRMRPCRRRATECCEKIAPPHALPLSPRPTPYHIIEREMYCASQQNRLPFVRYESLTDVAADLGHVRFTPETGHEPDIEECPLCATSRHLPLISARCRRLASGFSTPRSRHKRKPRPRPRLLHHLLHKRRMANQFPFDHQKWITRLERIQGNKRPLR